MDNNKNLALSIVLLIIGMCLLVCASVPIYSLFCKATGYGGTVKTSANASTTKGSRKITVKFDANIDKDLPWDFKPQQKEIEFTIGENVLIFYYAKNLSNAPIIATAVYNVSPEKAAQYFTKIQCFCFEEQLLAPNQEMMMPVTFYIDPKMDEDPTLKDVKVLTLSYSFYKVR
jgi:cytochrome c oxidase assembly protein subunit 11